MSVAGKFTITYGGKAFGGASSSLQLLGPYVLSKDYNTLRVTFDVIVVATSYALLQSISDDLELAMKKRDQDLVISIDGNTWTYTNGTHFWNTFGSATKSGDSETDQGYSRSYTCEVTGELPSDDVAATSTGLRDLELSVDYLPGRAATMSMQGVYTATESGVSASDNYLAGADSEATTFLATVSGTFELVDEQYTYDRNNFECQWSRQYVQLLANQSQATLDDTKIRDFNMKFTDLSQHPGDSQESIYRMRRVVGTYDCAADIAVTTDLKALVDNTIFPHLKELFNTNFTPQVFAIEDHRYSYDESNKRVSVSVQFVYQAGGGDEIVEVTQTTAYREQRNLDQTGVHFDDEYAAEVDVGWAILDRIATRTVKAIGEMEPQRRIGRQAAEGLAGPIQMPGREAPAGAKVVQSGWNIISNTSQTQQQWLGDPNEEQILMTLLTETVVERWNTAPRGRGTSAGTGSAGPITGQ